MISRQEMMPKAVAAVTALGLFIGGNALTGCNSVDKVGNSGKEISKDIDEHLKPGGELDVAATIVAVDEGVNYRTTPVRINTDNTQMVDGNEVTPIDLSNSTLQEDTVLVRPVIVKNETRFDSNDPTYWLGGLQNDEMVWVGINGDTKPYLHFYERNQSDGELPDLEQTITVRSVSSTDGVIFQSDGYEASAALIRPSTGTDDPYLQAQQQEGYRAVPTPSDF